MHEVAQRPSERRSLEVDLFRLSGFESYYKFTREKEIGICCVGSRVRYHSLSYWSIIMTSPVEFSTGEFRAKRGMKSPLKWRNQPRKKWRTFRKSKEGTGCYIYISGDPFFQQFRLHSPPQGNWVEFTFAQTSGLSITFTSNAQTRICTTWPSLPFTCRLLFIISTHKLVVSRNFLSIKIVLSCFYLLIFNFEKCSTWIWLLSFAIYVKLKTLSWTTRPQ